MNVRRKLIIFQQRRPSGHISGGADIGDISEFHLVLFAVPFIDKHLVIVEGNHIGDSGLGCVSLAGGVKSIDHLLDKFTGGGVEDGEAFVAGFFAAILQQR